MTVAIVVEPECTNLEQLAAEMPTWAIDTSFNRKVAEESVWPRYQSKPSAEGLTLYKVRETSDRFLNCVSVIDTVELHHPAMQSLLLIGVQKAARLQDSLMRMGYTLRTENSMLIAERVSSS